MRKKFHNVKIYNLASWSWALIMLNSGLNKIFQYFPVTTNLPADAMKFVSAFTESGYIFQLIAGTEILGGILLMTNRFRALGALILLPIMVNILAFHTLLAHGGLILAIVLFIINIWVIVVNKEKFLPLIK